MAAGQGLEPQYHPPEGCVLPLDEPAKYNKTKFILPQKKRFYNVSIILHYKL